MWDEWNDRQKIKCTNRSTSVLILLALLMVAGHWCTRARERGVDKRVSLPWIIVRFSTNVLFLNIDYHFVLFSITTAIEFDLNSECSLALPHQKRRHDNFHYKAQLVNNPTTATFLLIKIRKLILVPWFVQFWTQLKINAKNLLKATTTIISMSIHIPQPKIKWQTCNYGSWTVWSN